MKRAVVFYALLLTTVIFSISLTYGLEIKKNETYNPEGYRIPDLKTAELQSEQVMDIKEVEGKKMLIRTYKAKDGDLFRVYSIDGRIFRYDVDIDKKPPYEYALIDRNGDGIFETKQDLTGEAVIEGKKEKYYIDIEHTAPYEYIYIGERTEGSYEWRQKLKGESFFIPMWTTKY